MPCNCTKIRTDNCNCKNMTADVSINNNKNFKSTEIVVGHELATNVRCIHYLSLVKHNFLLNIPERVYEICATFNIRYCPFRGSLRNKHCVIHVLKDFMVLLCFFAANFVVLLMIVTRMTVHISCIFLEAVRWAQRGLTSNLSETTIGVLSRHNLCNLSKWRKT